MRKIKRLEARVKELEGRADVNKHFFNDNLIPGVNKLGGDFSRLQDAVVGSHVEFLKTMMEINKGDSCENEI